MKKKIIYLSIILVVVISLITLSSIYKSKDNKYKKKYNTISKGMAIMIKEEGATDYTKSTSKDIPKGNYVLNEEKTYCENNGKVTNYNSTTGTVSLNFIGSDRCYLYFDYYFEPKGYEKILLDNGADVNKKTSDGLTSLDIAVLNNQLAIIKMLLSQGGALSGQVATELKKLGCQSNLDPTTNLYDTTLDDLLPVLKKIQSTLDNQ